MQSPENEESTRINVPGDNSKMHTPCRQVGLRRKRSCIINTNIKKSSITETETKTDVMVKESENSSVIHNVESVSLPTIIADENGKNKSPVKDRTIEEGKLAPTACNKVKEAANSHYPRSTKNSVEALEKSIREKEENVARLKLAKLYRKKHDASTLSKLTDKWREGCQVALQELLNESTSRGYQINMTQLMTQLGIPFDLIHYNPDLEDFE